MLFFITLVLIACLGYLAQTTGLCMVKGMNQAVKRKPMFLVAILLSGSFAWLPLLIANFSVERNMFISYEATWFSAVGGLIFGFGAAINHGCGVSTVSRLARGDIAMLATILGWLAGWVLLASFISKVESHVYILPQYMHFIGGALLSILLVIALFRFNKENQKLWLSMLSIGMVASIIFLYERHWTPSGLLKDISLFVWYGNERTWPSVERFLLIFSLILGMLIAAIVTRSFVFKWFTIRLVARHLLAGVLMGIGAVLASGGNDTQLLLALPAFSPAGLVAVVFMLFGIYLGGIVSKIVDLKGR
ncbi:YeeE/YedE family protein [Moritella sp. 24]|uniref:YeeE/YedE thiosulfate transporter family protein n=1 Tax=Moritella sp. 24 TaxID=2746230 RepID=UPI001BAD2F6D|nr:YeeE/YedE thiosulfate transporter family protein [Moritella sp. 24]QUM75071.1 YeeE/YedE family protein [Moritella sp. 24]